MFLCYFAFLMHRHSEEMVQKLRTMGLGFYMSDKEKIPKLGMYQSVAVLQRELQGFSFLQAIHYIAIQKQEGTCAWVLTSFPAHSQIFLAAMEKNWEKALYSVQMKHFYYYFYNNFLKDTYSSTYANSRYAPCLIIEHH